jgi:hypothetical protein
MLTMLGKHRSKLSRKRPHIGLLSDSSGTSAIEFALLLPLLVLMLFGTVELHRYILHTRQIAAAAKAVATMIAQRGDGYSASETPSMEFDLVAHMFPAVNPIGSPHNWWTRLGFQIRHVVFTPTVLGCTSSCTYRANLAWQWGGGVTCGPMPAAAAGATPTSGTIPAAALGPGSMTIVDLQYNFAPLLGSTIVPTKTIVAQGLASTRFASPYIVNQSTSNVVRCPGY